MQRSGKPAIVIPEGNSIQFQLTWTGLDALTPEAPTSVVYQVFDRRTDLPVSEERTVDSPAASMTFIVPGEDLPAGPGPTRELDVQIRGTFSIPTDIHTMTAGVVVVREYG